MKIITIRPNDDISFLHDHRVNKIVDLLLKDDTNLYLGITHVINTIYSYDELLEKADNIFNIYENLCEYWPILINIYKDKDKDNLRGAVLERLGYKLLMMKYGKRCYNDVRCWVCIDNCESWKSDLTVDVLFYEKIKDIGEVFECKVSPNNFGKDHIDNLKKIFHKSNQKIYPAILSFSSINAIEWRLRELYVTVKEINYFGYENLKQISNFHIYTK